MSGDNERTTFESPADKSRSQLMRDLARAQSRIRRLVEEMGEIKGQQRQRAKALSNALEKAEQLERANVTLSKAWADETARREQLQKRLEAAIAALRGEIE